LTHHQQESEQEWWEREREKGITGIRNLDPTFHHTLKFIFRFDYILPPINNLEEKFIYSDSDTD